MQLALGAGAMAGGAPRRIAAHVPGWIEAFAVFAAIAFLLPLFDRVGAFGNGRDGRFAETALVAAPEAGVRESAPAVTSAPPMSSAAVPARKNEAMRELLPLAGSQWAAALLLGYFFVVWSRRSPSPALGAGVALGCWAVAAWLARVPWPFIDRAGFEPARIDAALTSRPAGFVVAIGAAALVLLGVAFARRLSGGGRAPRVAAQAMSSRVGYAGLVLATGLGWLVLLDLSANAHPGNRYLALYHQGHLWLGLTIFSVLVFVREPLSRALGWLLAVAGEAWSLLARRVGGIVAAATAVLLAGALVLVVGEALANMRQLTSELGRVWLIVGAAWFFFLRAGPLAERLAHDGARAVSFWRYVAPLALVVGVLLFAMLVTRDMGPLLIAGYAAGAFLAATVAAWLHLRGAHASTPARSLPTERARPAGERPGSGLLASLTGVVLFAGWIGAATLALFAFGAVDPTTAARLESLAAPYASANDQLALVSWFQRAAPAEGFGLGAVPWCGFAAGDRCGGVPAQIHSDYTFTAIVGLFGAAVAWAASIGVALWLHRLVRHHGRVTRGEPLLRAGTGAGVVGRDGQSTVGHDGQALLSWIAVAWVVLTLCQLAVTVAGNLAVLPLTGVTFPFVSFGLTSLIVNLAFLALCINVTLPLERRRG